MDVAPDPPTRTSILDAAQAAVLSKGFSGTSIDELIAAVGISKSGFFYHFRDKAELARALLVRYIEEDNKVFDEVFSKADELSEDPLHAYLIALRLLAKVFEDLPREHPGCMVAAICYHEQLFNQEIRRINRDAILMWRGRFRERLEKIAQRYPPRVAVDLNDLADMLAVVVDGAIIISRVVQDKMVLAHQTLLYRELIRFIFEPGPTSWLGPSPQA